MTVIYIASSLIKSCVIHQSSRRLGFLTRSAWVEDIYQARAAISHSGREFRLGSNLFGSAALNASQFRSFFVSGGLLKDCSPFLHLKMNLDKCELVGIFW